MLLKVLVFGIFCFTCWTTCFADFSWPHGLIPYLDDFALVADPDQAVALNNARMDLQVRSCVKFVPRRLEQDFVFFTDLGPQVECWNMFEQTKGRVPVNAGPSCLEPMRRPHRPKRVFSECDVEFVNHLYNCPRRRKSSPICPPGQNIMSRPSTTTTTTTTTATTTEVPTTVTEPSTTTTEEPTTTTTPEPTTESTTESTITTTTTEESTTTTTTTEATTTTEEETTTTTTEPPPPATTTTTQMMMTLITTTTIASPPPDWVQSVEESFEGRRLEGGGMEQASTNTRPQSQERSVEQGGKEVEEEEGDVAVEVIDYAGSEAGAMGIAAGGAKGSNSGASSRGDADRAEGSLSISQTKVTTTIEKSKYVGPCGSACTYSGDLVKLYRSYNDKAEITDHFYTSDRLEHHLMASQGYLMQPHMGYLGRNDIDPACSCLKPLYRLYNDFMKDHLLTSTEHEKNMAEKILGYKFEKVLGFCTKEPGCGAYMPLYRFYNAIAKDHLYTVDQQEMHYYRTHPEHAYGFEYIECYVWQTNSSVKGCPAMLTATQGEDFLHRLY